VRFPNGIDGLARYVHSKGLKLGLYTDIGTHTCGGYPGSFGHFDIDAKTFARWGIDSLKVDGCYANASQFPVLYPKFGASLAKTGRPIVFQCSWPAYIIGSANFSEIASFCNMWRAFDDIQDSSDSLFSIIRWWSQEPQMSQMIAAAGPGAWNDADMILAGDFGLSVSQAQMQFGVWAMIASPLMMSNDLRKIDKSMAAIVLNKDVIAVNQDKLGKQGKMIASLSTKEIQWWTRPLANGDLAVLALCLADDAGSFFRVNATLTQLGWPRNSANVRDLYARANVGTAVGVLTLTLAPSTSQMVRLS
jgi:alpha-N-acetylgalactosaminidase